MDGGSSFNQEACPMKTALHHVEVSCPEAFASLPKRRSLFPCAPGYSRNSVPPEGRGRWPLGEQALSCEILRWPHSLFRGPTRSCFSRWPCASEPTETRFGCQGATGIFFLGRTKPDTGSKGRRSCACAHDHLPPACQWSSQPPMRATSGSSPG